jgi:hypothetical protein
MPALVLGFYRTEKPVSGNGWARYADALLATGRGLKRLRPSRRPGHPATLSGTADSAALLARFGAYLTRRIITAGSTACCPIEGDQRPEAACLDQAATARPLSGPGSRCRPAIPMPKPASAAAHHLSAPTPAADRPDPLSSRRRQRADGSPARRPAASVHRASVKSGKLVRNASELAQGAASDRQWTLAYNIARQIDDAFPPGTQMLGAILGVRDHYTSLAWLAGGPPSTGFATRQCDGDVLPLCPGRQVAAGRDQGAIIGPAGRRLPPEIPATPTPISAARASIPNSSMRSFRSNASASRYPRRASGRRRCSRPGARRL